MDSPKPAECLVRPFIPANAPHVTAVYANFVKSSTATMEIVAPNESETIRRWRWSSQSGIVSGILNTITLLETGPYLTPTMSVTYDQTNTDPAAAGLTERIAICSTFALHRMRHRRVPLFAEPPCSGLPMQLGGTAHAASPIRPNSPATLHQKISCGLAEEIVFSTQE